MGKIAIKDEAECKMAVKQLGKPVKMVILAELLLKQ